MAAPAVALAVKAAVAAATDKRTWKVIAVTITAVLMPFILAVLLLMSFLSGGAAHNNDAVNLAFHGGTISSDVPSEYRQHIEEMQDAFSQLDDAIAQLHIESGDGSLDSTRVKAVFYSLYFGAEHANVQPHSGAQANFAGYYALLEIGEFCGFFKIELADSFRLFYNARIIRLHRPAFPVAAILAYTPEPTPSKMAK